MQIEIPPQRVHGWVRNSLKCIFLPFVLLDLSMQRLAKKIIRPPFKQVGQCLKRGACCEYVMIEHRKGIFGKIFYYWHTEINGFYKKKHDIHDYDGKHVYVMGCRYLKKDGSCGNYRLRPTVCRKWPVIEHFGNPRILKGCGFRAIPRSEKPKMTGALPKNL